MEMVETDVSYVDYSTGSRFLKVSWRRVNRRNLKIITLNTYLIP
jgi:hypothetical protein